MKKHALLIAAMLPMIVGCESDSTGIGDAIAAACPGLFSSTGGACGHRGDGWFPTTVPDSVFSASTRLPRNAVVGDYYSHLVEVSCISTCSQVGYTWSITVGSLPTGLSLGPTTNADATFITGTPTEVGTFNFTVTLEDSDGRSATAALSITVGLLQLLHPHEPCSDYFDEAIATFEDANLEASVRAALGVGVDVDLTCGIISGVTDLDAAAMRIVSLVGIKNLTNLSHLNLSGNWGLGDRETQVLTHPRERADVLDIRKTRVSCVWVETALNARWGVVHSDCS